ncbi:helix-turn-helix domain-containing protein [Pseudoduganella sp. FT25W]|uniref:Helix-turn-helix domain-containing protein n=1 Tax=Duganella alba TaxID=2666081 RepID=A0A6L5QSH7_9BURK|nr:AraC family transcriptional regulator [Duganella alba]MRX11781.1 helix-turn-helix domain-containing protein [Duganella alba]MRX20233.1 helix-turn-helix domain-containing protein [Duganella alba]
MQHKTESSQMLHASCAALSVRSGLLPAPPAGRRAQHEIVVPGMHASATLTYRAADGAAQQVRVTDRHVSFLPAGHDDGAAWQAGQPLTVIALQADFLDALARRNGMRHLEMAPQYAAVDPLMWHMTRFIERQLHAQRGLESAYLEALACVIGQHLLSTYADSPPVNGALGGLPYYKVRRAIDYIRAHYREDIGFKDIAAYLDMSPFHFSRMFKHSTSQSPRQYISRYRIEAAKKMLVESDRAIADVALEVGYKSQSHFTTRFALWVGMTPAAFRATR